MNSFPTVQTVIKTSFITLSLFGLSYWLCMVIAEPIIAQNYFTVSWEYSIKVVALMLANLYVFSLSVGLWYKWKPYALITLPVCISIFITLFRFNQSYAAIAAAIFFLFFSYDIYKSMEIKNNMVRFSASTVLKLSASGMLFLFSVMGGVMVIITSTHLPNINIGKNISNVVEKPVTELVEKQINTIPGGSTWIDPSQLNINGLIESQVNYLLEPYKNLLNPIIAVLMFALFQFYATIARIIFGYTVDIVFYSARKSGFLKFEKVMVEQEILRF